MLALRLRINRTSPCSSSIFLFPLSEPPCKKKLSFRKFLIFLSGANSKNLFPVRSGTHTTDVRNSSVYSRQSIKLCHLKHRVSVPFCPPDALTCERSPSPFLHTPVSAWRSTPLSFLLAGLPGGFDATRRFVLKMRTLLTWPTSLPYPQRSGDPPPPSVLRGISVASSRDA